MKSKSNIYLIESYFILKKTRNYLKNTNIRK